MNVHDANDVAIRSPHAGVVSLTVVILTRDEGMHLARALKSVAGLAERVVIVDSGSTDDTRAIAVAHGAEVFERRFVNYADQFQWALDNSGITSDWILRLDADEVIEDDLRAQIATDLPAMPASVVGINIDRKHIFMDRWVRRGGRYPLTLLRLFRTGHGRIEQRWMDEHLVVWGGETRSMRGGFSDINLNDLSFFTDKHNKYATREAIDVLSRRYGLTEQDEALNSRSASRQASWKRAMKERIYNRLPLGTGPLLYFLYRYIFQLGFLDGRQGTIYHVLQGFWYRFLVDAKVYELERGMAAANARTAAERRAVLTTLTRHQL